jgi:hypothetical protein
VCLSLEDCFAITERGSRNADERFLQAMIHAYIDDSGDGKKKEYAVCGGILGEGLFNDFFWSSVGLPRLVT